MTRIVVDSTCDLPQAVMTALDIVMVPLKVHFGDEEFRDKIDLDEATFYDRLQTVAALPTTSQPSPGDFVLAYESLPADEPVLSIHIAGALSGTAQSARLAATQLEGRDIRIVDSGSVSWGAGLLVMAASDALREGKGADETVSLMQQIIPRIRLIAALDTLKYVIMGGRVSRAQGVIGGLLRVKPMIMVKEGQLHREPPARTWGQAYDRILEDIGAHDGAERMAVIQAHAPEAAEALRDLLIERFPGIAIEMGGIGPVVGTHAGPGAVGVAYIARKAD
ncbi:MAG: DegV family protein [Candidatus Dormibacteria bacterium]